MRNPIAIANVDSVRKLKGCWGACIDHYFRHEPGSTGRRSRYLHFDGVDEVDGFRVVREIDELARASCDLVSGGGKPRSSLRSQVGL